MQSCWGSRDVVRGDKKRRFGSCSEIALRQYSHAQVAQITLVLTSPGPRTDRGGKVGTLTGAGHMSRLFLWTINFI